MHPGPGGLGGLAGGGGFAVVDFAGGELLVGFEGLDVVVVVGGVEEGLRGGLRRAEKQRQESEP